MNTGATSMETVQNSCMQIACLDAVTGVTLLHGGPFGAMIRRNGRTISVAHNTVLADGDPTCHAEMNAIRQACQHLGTHDLSDCELYTTCEPCPMCLGGAMWSRIGKMYIAVDRATSAAYGLDFQVFYDEVEAIGTQRSTSQMLRVVEGVAAAEGCELFANLSINRTKWLPGESDAASEADVKYMRLAINAAKNGARKGLNKEREPFGACIVSRSSNAVIATSCNTVLKSCDATATAEINAIRQAARAMNTYVLDDCAIYCTAHPDVMSLAAILWARIPVAYFGVSQELVFSAGFEEGLIQFRELAMAEKQRKISVVRDVLKSTSEDVFRLWHQSGFKVF